jgi:hypothetical protein
MKEHATLIKANTRDVYVYGTGLCDIQYMKSMKSRLVEDHNLDACGGSIESRDPVIRWLHIPPMDAYPPRWIGSLPLYFTQTQEGTEQVKCIGSMHA